MKEDIKNKNSEMQHLDNSLDSFIKVQHVITNSNFCIDYVRSGGLFFVVNFNQLKN